MIITDKTGIKTVTGALHRLISNEKFGCITVIEGTKQSKTWTKQDVEEFTTEKLVVDRIKEKGWKVLDETAILIITKAA